MTLNKFINKRGILLRNFTCSLYINLLIRCKGFH